MELLNEIHTMEQAVIGCLIHYPQWFRVKSLDVLPALFGDSKHFAIVETLHEMDLDGIPTDTLVLKQKMREKGYTDELLAYIDDLPKKELEEDVLDAFIRAIGQRCERRNFHQLGGRLLVDSVDMTLPVHRLYEQTETTLQYLNQLLRAKEVKPLKQIIKSFIMESEPNFATHLDWFSPEMNNSLNGLGKGELIIMGARPGMGKTACMLSQLLFTASVQQKPVALISYEQSSEMLMKRLLANYTGLPLSDLISRKPLMQEQEKRLLQGMNTLSDLPIHIVDNANLGLFELRNTLRKLKTNMGIELVCVDYVQIIPTYRKTNIREQEISLISRVLKQIARELDIPILANAQLSRASERRGAAAIPMLSDLREGGSLEQDADKVLFLYRPEYYGITEFEDGRSTENMAEIHIAKNRMGVTGCSTLLFNKATCSFTAIPFEYKPPIVDDYLLPPNLDELFDAPF